MKKKKYIQPHTVGIAITEAQHKILKEIAALEERSVSSLVRHLVVKYIGAKCRK